MLKRVSSSAFVCLSCRSQLAKPFSTLTQRLTSKPVASRSPTVSENLRLKSSTSPPNADAKSSQNLPDAKSATKEKRPFRYAGKVHKRRGERLKEGSARLSVDTLGKPAEVIILRDLEPHEDDPVEILKVTEEKRNVPEVGLSSQQILDSLSEEKKTQTLEEALQQIELLRPTRKDTYAAESLIVAPKKLAKLKSHLVRDFTVAQLKAYLRTPVKPSNGRPPNHGQNTQHLASAFQVTAWRPEVASPTDVSALQEWRPWTKIRFQKKRLVSQILRGTWRLLSTDEIEERGQLEIHNLTPVQYHLLVDGVTSTLQQIASARSTTAETQPQQRVIRITGSQNQANSAVNDIRQFLQRVHTKTLEVSLLLPHSTILKTPSTGTGDVLSELLSALPIIENSTQTGLQMTSVTGQPHQVQIHGVDQGDLDEATRMILGLIKHIADSSVPWVPFKVAKMERAKPKPLYCALFSQATLPLFLRDRQLLRLHAAVPRCRPIPGQPQEPLTYLPHLNDLVLSPVAVSDNSLETLSKGNNPFRCKAISQPEGSDLRSRTELSVSFGTLVAQLSDLDAPAVTVQQSFATPRVFLNALPNLPATISGIQSFGERPRSAKLVFHLRPYSGSLARKYHLPDLFVEFQVGALYGNSRNAELLQIKWRHRHVAMNVELPFSPADLRVSRSESLVADQAAANKTGSFELMDWIEATKRSIEDSGPIKPPPKVTTKIPLSLFSPEIQFTQTKQTIKSKGKKNTKKAKTIEESAMKAAAAAAEVPVEYLYVQVEHEEMTDAPFGAFKLVQTNQDGGKLGGRSSTLSLLVPQSIEDKYTQDWRDTSLRLMENAQSVLELLQHQFHQEARFKQRLPGEVSLGSQPERTAPLGNSQDSAASTHHGEHTARKDQDDGHDGLHDVVEPTVSTDTIRNPTEMSIAAEEDEQPRAAAGGSA